MPNKEYDLIVVGGGPAGMIAAGRAAELGAKVAILEKNSKLGKKLLISGGGRCNLTNAEFDTRKMIEKYGSKGKALFGAFARFGVEDVIRFFNNRGMPTKIEEGKRVFPQSNKAEDVWKVLIQYLKEGKVEIVYNAPVVKILHSKNKITGIVTDKKTFVAKKYIIATGGKSHPETGSTGEGFDWFKELGHSVAEADTALVPIKIQESWVKKLLGVSFSEVKLTALQDNKKRESRTGKLLLTHFGISGPLALNMSKDISELYKYGPVILHLDLYPSTTAEALDKQLLESLQKVLNRQIKNSLAEVLLPKMIPTILELAEIDGNTEGNALTKEQRRKIVSFAKALPMTVSGFLGPENAIVTSGGVSVKEVDFKIMQSKICSNLYLAGDVLDFDRPSGGFSLQICWTTGYIAGENCAK